MVDKKADSLESKPLGLTVYDLPEPGAVADADARQTASGRLRMLLVLLVCAAPVIASYLTYYVVRPQSLRSFGELILPVAAMPDLQAKDLKGQTVALSSLKKQWLLVSVAGGACPAECQQNLFLQRQTRAALGRERDRTDWVWLVTDDAPLDAALLVGLKDAIVLRVPQAEVSQWLKPQAASKLEDHLYLVDPNGDWMMRFPAHLQIDQAPKMRKDWDRLLRASVSWDKAGR
jgi:hypothetical protein